MYAPTSDYGDDEAGEFYDQLHNVIDQTPKKDIRTMPGDWNAKVGKHAQENGHNNNNNNGDLYSALTKICTTRFTIAMYK